MTVINILHALRIYSHSLYIFIYLYEEFRY